MISTKIKLLHFLILMVSQFSTTQAQEINENHPLYYKKRADRKEGIYNKPLKFAVNPDKVNSNFVVVGFTVGKFYFVRTSNEIIQVHTTYKSDLIARSAPTDLSYKYRLDADLKTQKNSISWPVKDVLWHLEQLTPDNMGIFGYDNGFFIPIYIENNSFINDSTLRIHVTSKIPVKDIRYRLLDINGRLFEKSDWKAIKINGKTYARAGQLVTISLPNICEKCILEIQAINRDTGTPLADNFNILLKP